MSTRPSRCGSGCGSCRARLRRWPARQNRGSPAGGMRGAGQRDLSAREGSRAERRERSERRPNRGNGAGKGFRGGPAPRPLPGTGSPQRPEAPAAAIVSGTGSAIPAGGSRRQRSAGGATRCTARPTTSAGSGSGHRLRLRRSGRRPRLHGTAVPALTPSPPRRPPAPPVPPPVACPVPSARNRGPIPFRYSVRPRSSRRSSCAACR